jgi:glycerol-3-phosphate dehydrogenase
MAGCGILEFFEFRLVKEALIEREILLSAMPHISWPMRFVLPFHRDMRFEGNTPTSKLLSFVMPWMKGRRPSWLIRVGLFLYDNMGGRKLLPATKTVDLKTDPVGAPLDDRFAKAFEYSDCWIEDSRLVILNARDAQARGANIMPRTKVLSADRFDDHWKVTVEGGQVYHAKCLVNAGGPWVEDIIRGHNSAKHDRGCAPCPRLAYCHLSGCLITINATFSKVKTAALSLPSPMKLTSL